MTTATQVEDLLRELAPQVLGVLVRRHGDFDTCEDAVQEALLAAALHWPAEGAPRNPKGWLITVASRRRTELWRNDSARRRREESAASLEPPQVESIYDDDTLTLLLLCAHPSLTPVSQVALTLRAVCGLATPAVARAFLVSEETMAQRLVRAKQKIREAKIPYETPAPDRLDERVEGVLAVIYLVFTEGYAVTSGADLMREDLALEAIRLARLLDGLLPGRPAIQGLLALTLLHHARRNARATPEGDIVLLEDQDRGLWDRAEIADGLALVEHALRAPGRPSSYAVQAAIAALHARAPRHDATDWPQIVGLYEVLLRLHPSPVVELNHAAAVSMVDGPGRALDLLDALSARGSLVGYRLLPAVRADVLRRLAELG